MHLIGIDAGGTKTVCLLANEREEILAEARAGGANLQASGELEVEKVLHQVMDAAIGDRSVRPDAICVGIAGVDRPGDAEVIRGIMRRIGFKTPAVVVNDALIALAAGAGDGPGVVIVAGTGSIAYGRNAAGRAARSGGWGYMLGDEGGGFWIGRSALAAVVRQFDGRGPETRLTPLILREMGLETPAALIHAVYDRGLQRAVIGQMAAVVGRAAREGDAVAADILSRAAAELTAVARSVVNTLDMRGEVFPILLTGGVFAGAPTLAHDVASRLAEVAPRSAVRPLGVEPAIGAVRIARAAANGTLTLPSYDAERASPSSFLLPPSS